MNKRSPKTPLAGWRSQPNADGGLPVKLEPSMFFILLFIVALGIAYLLPPKEAAQICGSSSYWAVLVTFLLVFPAVFLAQALQKHFPDHNILAASKETFGNYLGACLNLFFLALLIGNAIAIIRDTAELVSTYLLDTTPNWAVIGLFLLCSGFIASHGLTGISRLAGFVFIPTLTLRILLQFLALQDLKVTHLLPLFSASPIDYLKGGLTLTTAFGPLLVGLFFIYPLLAKPKKMTSIALGLIGGQTVILFFTMIIVIGVFGAVNVQTYIWPIFEVDRRIDIPLLVFNQVGLLFLIVWFTMFLVGFSFYLYVFASSMKQQFEKLNYLWCLIGILVLIQAGGMLIPNLWVDLWILRIIRHNALYLIYGYPLLIWVGTLVRGLGRKRNGK
jgi:spore germination protein (amino acid permease)